MKHLEKLKEALCEELDKFAKSGDITVNSLLLKKSQVAQVKLPISI